MLAPTKAQAIMGTIIPNPLQIIMVFFG
jgi:hypothetical protein